MPAKKKAPPKKGKSPVTKAPHKTQEDPSSTPKGFESEDLHLCKRSERLWRRNHGR